MTFWNSTIEPGHPCVITSGIASACGERTWMKWIPTPSMVVLNCGNRLRRCSRAPVILLQPVRRDLFRIGERQTLGPVVDALALGPSGLPQSALEVGELGV